MDTQKIVQSKIVAIVAQAIIRFLVRSKDINAHNRNRRVMLTIKFS